MRDRQRSARLHKRRIVRQVTRAELQRQVLELRVRHGLTYAEVGARLGISEYAAYRGYRAAIAAIPEPIASEARRESLEHLEFIRSEALRRLKDDPPAYLVILLRVEERRARLLGLDPRTPSVEVNVLGPHRGVIPIALARQMLRDIENSGDPIKIDDIVDIDTEKQVSQDDSNTDEQPLPAVVSVEEARAALKALESEGGADGDSAED